MRTLRSVVSGPVYFVRHGDAESDELLLGAELDLRSLTELGTSEAEAAATHLAAIHVRRLITSPLARAVETAAIIAKRLGLPIIEEADLIEWRPSLSGQAVAGTESTRRAREMWALGGEWPAGESKDWEPLSALRDRAVGGLRKHGGDGASIVVTHGALIESILGDMVETGEVRRWDWTPTWLRRWPPSELRSVR